MLAKENIVIVEEVSLSNIDYAFFTNEDGVSDGGYLIDDKKTRNVNIYSSKQKAGNGFDPADRVLANIQTCFEELGAGSPIHHQFFMTSYYANMGKSAPRIFSCDNLADLNALKKQALQNLDDENPESPNCLSLDPDMKECIRNSGIAVIKADALIFKGIPGESIAVLGASGDAHPIMMFDDENKIACYIAGAHSALKQGVLQQSFDAMIKLGANESNIRLVIGPGLGAKSYEFGPNAPEYFSLQDEAAKVLSPVKDTEGNPKYLIDVKELVTILLKNRLNPENIYNTALDTMGFDLYDEIKESEESRFLKRKTKINFEELNKNGPLFFGARRTIMEQTGDLMEHNPGAFNTVGRHGAGFCLKP